MGSFAYTCCVSGLPIEYGDPVRFFLLTQNPYNQAAENCCYPHDRWVPRTFPLRAKYNDYGSVMDLQEGVQRSLWFEGFQIDLVKRGVGENTCHDVPVRKNMSLKMLLEALWEGRVLIKDLQDLGKRKTNVPEKVPAGIPTTQRISDIIQKAELTLTDGNFSPGYKVSLQRRGVVRVRYEDFDAEVQTKALDRLQDYLSDYASMITVGDKPYQGDSELVIAPLPGRYEYAKDRRDKSRRLAVAQAMIREDVWQAIIKQTFESWVGNQFTVSDFLGDIKKAQVTIGQFFKDSPDFPSHLTLGGNNLSVFATKDLVPFVVGLGYHFQLMTRKENVPAEEMEDFLQTAAEFSFIHSFLSQVRFMWAPSSGAGPQFGEWGRHVEFLGCLRDIAAEKYRQQKEEEEAD